MMCVEDLMSTTGNTAAVLSTGLRARTIVIQSVFPIALKRNLKFKSNRLTARYAKAF